MINENLGSSSPDQISSAAASGPGLEPGASLKLAPPPAKAKAEAEIDESHKTWGHLDRRFSLSAVLSTMPGFGNGQEVKKAKSKPSKAKG